MRGTEIIVTAEPHGRRLEGIISGTPKPGTCMQIQAGTAVDANGHHTWEVFNRAADGNQYLIAVLLPDVYRGKTYSDAYANGDLGFLYCPLPGEELNMLIANIAGTSDAFAVGDQLIVDDGTGKLVATTGTPESEPFQLLEASAALTADTLLWCLFTGY